MDKKNEKEEKSLELGKVSPGIEKKAKEEEKMEKKNEVVNAEDSESAHQKMALVQSKESTAVAQFFPVLTDPEIEKVCTPKPLDPFLLEKLEVRTLITN